MTVSEEATTSVKTRHRTKREEVKVTSRKASHDATYTGPPRSTNASFPYVSVPSYPPARYTFIHALFFLQSGHLCILAAHTSQHTRWPHSL